MQERQTAQANNMPHLRNSQRLGYECGPIARYLQTLSASAHINLGRLLHLTHTLQNSRFTIASSLVLCKGTIDDKQPLPSVFWVPPLSSRSLAKQFAFLLIVDPE